jgi:glycosyltransferase involved in cell wall biosynthesis
MKIALYVPSWPPGNVANGIVTYASQLVPALRRIGHEVFVLTPSKLSDDDDPYTIDLRRIKHKPSIWERAVWKLVPELAGFTSASSVIGTAIGESVEKHKFDIIEMEDAFGLSFAISKLKLLPDVVRLHGPWFLNKTFVNPDVKGGVARRRIKWEGRAIKHAQLVTAPSNAVLRDVKSYYGISLTASQVIPNPFEAASEAETWGLGTCSRDGLLFVGRFDSLKGGDLVLQTFSEIAVTYPRLTLTFVGPDYGIKTDNGETQTFEKFVHSRFPKYRHRIKFYGQLSHSDVMSLRRKHFATIIASRQETFSYSVLEAMSVGCPLITAAVGGIPELIQDQMNGLLVPFQDVKAMAVACQKLLDNPALAARLGWQAWMDCRTLYSPENIAKQTIAAYQQAINNFTLRNADHLARRAENV